MKTLIVDDERLARKELMSLLEPHKKIEVIGEATDVDDAIEKINELKEKWNETGNIPKEEYVELKKEFDMYMKKKTRPFSAVPRTATMKVIVLILLQLIF